MVMDKSPTKLEYYDDMWKLQSTATLVSNFNDGNGRHGLILDRTIFYPQGGGQPADTGFLRIHGLNNKFLVSDVRSKDGIVLHYGVFEGLEGEMELTVEEGKEVSLFVDEHRRKLNSRLHSAGHLLDICLPNIGLGHLEPGKAYHFSDGPWVEYKGVIPQNEMQNKQKELEQEANALISMGGKVSADILPYDEAAKLCDGCLPDYVPKESTPRIVRIGDNPGCPCGGTHVADISEIIHVKEINMLSPEGELKISFGYKCNNSDKGIPCGITSGYKILSEVRRTSSFSCLSGAALSANATLANTNICNGKIGGEILPTWDSPNSFRKVPSSPNLSKFDRLSSSLPSSLSYLSCSPPTPSDALEYDSSRSEGFLNAKEVQVAGGAAGEDRVQAVCSEENGWLFCAIYDGFNGRDAADFLAGTLYDTIISYLDKLIWELGPDSIKATSDHADMDGFLQYKLNRSLSCHEDQSLSRFNDSNHGCNNSEASCESFSYGVLDSLERAFSQAENDFLYMVEQEMEERPDLVSIGSCVLLLLLYGNDLYTLNLGDSRAVLATCSTDERTNKSERLKAIQLTDSHTVDNEAERARLLADHPDDPKVIIAGKVKGKLKVTRAFGVGYLKKKNLNDALMGILRVSDLISPPYVSTQPSVNVHKISNSDQFVIVGSDGLFDFFNNDEAVKLVESYILINPFGDPAKFLIEQLVAKAADSAGQFPISFTKFNLKCINLLSYCWLH